MKTLLLLLLRFYRYAISPLLGQNCRFYPSCSAYAMEAIQLYGAARGSLLAGKRICRCHPWSDGGVDPVPPAREKSTSAPISESCDCGQPHADRQSHSSSPLS